MKERKYTAVCARPEHAMPRDFLYFSFYGFLVNEHRVQQFDRHPSVFDK